jgi:hypothetical protein
MYFLSINYVFFAFTTYIAKISKLCAFFVQVYFPIDRRNGEVNAAARFAQKLPQNGTDFHMTVYYASVDFFVISLISA